MFMLLISWLSLVTSETGSSPFKIMIVGDSLTAGYGVKEESAYPQLLIERFQKDGVEIAILNGGVSGDTTTGGLRRLPWMLNTAEPDLVVIALGGNDMLRGLPVHSTEENLKKMIQLARNRHLPVALFGIQAPRQFGETYSTDFNKMFLKVAHEERVPLLPNFILRTVGKIELNLTDLIHPNSEGHKVIADDVYPFLKNLVDKLRKSK